MNEGPISRFLETQKQAKNKPVIDYAFGTVSFGMIQAKSQPFTNEETTAHSAITVQDVNDFFSPSYHNVIGVQNNLLNVTGTEYLEVSSYQDEDSVYEVEGKPNVIDLLYTQDGVN